MVFYETTFDEDARRNAKADNDIRLFGKFSIEFIPISLNRAKLIEWEVIFYVFDSIVLVLVWEIGNGFFTCLFAKG